MSYDIDLYIPVTGENPLFTAQKDPDIDVPLSAEARGRNQRTITALKIFNPELEVFEFNTGVQIAAPNDGTGISIELFNDSGAISVPYWHDADTEKILGLIAEYLKIVNTAGGFGAYDPQSATLIDPSSGCGPSPVMYSVGVNALRTATKKPWWQFW